MKDRKVAVMSVINVSSAGVSVLKWINMDLLSVWLIMMMPVCYLKRFNKV